VSRPRRGRAKFPWERDSGDHETTYKRAIPFHERARLGLKGAIVIASFMVIRETTKDRVDVGPKLAAVIGIALVLVGIMDVLWTWRGKLEHVFIETRSAQFAAHGALIAVGGLMAIAGGVALS
jgi:hypothetical protein